MGEVSVLFPYPNAINYLLFISLNMVYMRLSFLLNHTLSHLD